MTVLDRAYAYLVGTPLDTPNKVLLDISAVTTAWGSLLGLLPALSALFSCIWIGLQIWAWFEKRHAERKAKRAAAQSNLPHA